MSSNNGNHNGDDKQMLRPTIIIGPGGTGNQVVRRLKKLVREHYGDTPTLIHFLVMDTDAATFNDRHWAPLPELNELERMPLYDPQVPFADVRENAGAYPEIHDWLPPTVDVGLLDRQEGSGQIRMLGRMSFYKSFGFFERRLDYIFTQCQRIQKQLEAMRRYEFDIAADPVIYVVSSVCGGQGAGVLIDLAVALREMARHRFPGHNLIGALAMPSVFADRIPRENRAKTLANTHAAMKEIDYLMHSPEKSRMQFRFPAPLERAITPQSPLFDICYLVDNCHRHGALSSAEEVYDQIATQLFLEIGTPFGARSESVRVNLNSVSGLELDKVYRTGRRYSGFGNHTISFDRERIVNWAALKSSFITINEELLGAGGDALEIERAANEFNSRHSISAAQTDLLLDAICSAREIAQEQVTVAYAEDRPDHAELADDLWTRLDAFWLRRAAELRSRMDARVRAMLEGDEQRRGLLAETEDLYDQWTRQRGVTAAHDLAEAMIARFREIESSLRNDQQARQTQADEHRQEAEHTREELLNIAEEMRGLSADAEDEPLWRRIWRAALAFFSADSWRADDLSDDELSSELSELDSQAEELRHEYLNHFNQTLAHRLSAEARAAATQLFAELASRLVDLRESLIQLKQNLTEAAERLKEELQEMDEELQRSRYIGANTMRRDVTADYVDQYLQMRRQRAADSIRQWLLPEGEFAPAALESRFDAEQLRKRYADHYAADILRGAERDSLAEMIERLHTAQTNGSLTSRIGEGLQFCHPFWDIRVPGNQFATEVLLVGMEQEYPAVRDYLEAHAVAQRGQVYAQIVPTAQDSVILISRIAHGASYYWHSQDENYYDEYQRALTFSNYPLHLRQEWRKLPEPIPEPQKYKKRVFGLGVAYEFIAVRGSAYYLDLERQYTLAGTTRHTTADWRTIPLLSAVPPPDQPPQPANPNKADLIGDRSRWETMQRFVEDERMVSLVRERLQELFNQQGREAMREELGRYCREVLEPAIGELEEDDLARLQLEVEVEEIREAIDELQPVTGRLKFTAIG
jgi:hypothetical protein